MNVTLPPDLEQIVADLVKKGSYPDPLTVIREALYRLNNEEDELDWDPEELRREIMRGIEDSSRQGKSMPFNEATIDRIREEGRRRREIDAGGRS